ncbi:hypothetical protein Bpfe_023174 [Biomphalaria pfeifferi]|uniref:Gustatory receptor n=1 Tax=Biomphalaria pfeifferi TaxID=112525 RepID=A0AAD8B4R5_BIOPF|nr:hypothetical protein Bpfe_023174 [Biomphalaria pfeifferi]
MASSSVDVWQVFNYPLKVLAIAGCSMPLKAKDSSTLVRQQRLYKIYQMFVCMLHSLSCARCFTFIASPPSDSDSSTSFFVQLYLILLYSSLVYASESIVSRFYLQDVMDSLQKYQNEFGFCTSLANVKKNVEMVVVYGNVTIFLSSVFLNGAALFWLSHQKDFYCYPLQYQGDIQSTVWGLSVNFTCFFICIPVSGFFILYSALVELVIAEFGGVSQEMSRLLSAHDQDGVFDTEFPKCSGQMSGVQVVVESSYVTWETFVFVWTSIRWGALPSAASSISRNIGAIAWSSQSKLRLQKIQLMIVQFTNEKIGIDIFGLITIDTSLLLMILGTVVTYGVVVVQFQLDKESSGQISENNTDVIR